MSTPLSIALSPYHLATREPPAMLALTLADHVITLVPEPAGGATRQAVHAAVKSSPRYLRLMESWRWSSPLWNAGVISSGIAHDQACHELSGVYDSIASEDSLAPLRVLTRGAKQRAAESAEKSLDFIAADMLRGGPDPGINIPVCAALDRFALRHNLCVARAGAASIAQRAEARLGARIFSIAIPILLRAGGGRIQLLRHDLHEPLSALRAAISQVLAHAEVEGAGPAADLAKRIDRLHRAAEDYTAAFVAWSDEGGGGRGDDENAQRITTGYIGLTAMLIPADAVLRSSRAAIRSLSGHRSGNGINGEHPDAPPADPGRLVALVVREMNMRPEA